MNAIADGNFGSCPLDAWLARQCGATTSRELPERLAQMQVHLLRLTLAQATRGAFYATRLQGYNLNLAKLEDLTHLPFTTADDLRNWGDFLCVSQGDVQRMVTLHTSGTTGQPKRLAFTDADLARTRDFFAVGMSQLVRAGQRLAVLLPGAERPDGVADLLRQALSSAGVEVVAPPPQVHMPRQPNGENVDLPQNETRGGEALARWLEQAEAHCLVAAPAQLANLLTWFPTQGPKILRVCSPALNRWKLPLGKTCVSIGNVRSLTTTGLQKLPTAGQWNAPRTTVFMCGNWTF